MKQVVGLGVQLDSSSGCELGEKMKLFQITFSADQFIDTGRLLEHWSLLGPLRLIHFCKQ
jgi:hypothetical protein